MRILTSEETPLDWESRKIGYYVEKHKGGAPLKPSDFSESGFPVIPKKAIQPGNQLVIKGQTYCTTQFADENTRSIVDNSYTITTLRDLVPTGPTIGTVVNFYTDEQYILSQGVYGLKLKDKISRDYFAYLSNTFLYRNVMRRVMVGSTQVHIRTPEYLNLEIQTPPLPEQRKIAQILSTWDRGIATTEKLIDASKQQKKALMQQLLTGKKRLVDPETGKAFEGEWEEVELGKITSIYDGTHSTPKYVEKGIPFYSVEHLTRDDFSNTKFITEEVFEKENKRVKLERDDILMTRIGDIGTAKHLNWDVCASFYVSLALIKANKSKFNSAYMGYYINSHEFHRELYKRTIHVAFPKKINLGEINHCKVLLPSISEQQKIAFVLTAADKEIELLAAKLAHFKQEKKALMQQLLTGKRRVSLSS